MYVHARTLVHGNAYMSMDVVPGRCMLVPRNCFMHARAGTEMHARQAFTRMTGQRPF